MAKNEFLEGFLKGLVANNPGNIDYHGLKMQAANTVEGNRQQDLRNAFNKQKMDLEMAEQGMIPQQPDPNDIDSQIGSRTQDFISKYVNDPSLPIYAQGPTGEYKKFPPMAPLPEGYAQTPPKESQARLFEQFQKTAYPGKGSLQQSQFIDSSDNTPLFFDRETRQYIRSDNGNLPIGRPTPIKGNAEAVGQASRGAVLLPKIDKLFDDLDKKGSISSRVAVAPIAGPILYPEITQLKNELKQVGFTFGGKNFTGNEEAIISGAMVPGPLDNKSSRDAKRKAIKGYVSGQITLMDAANLLGSAGKSIKDVIGGSPNPQQSQRTGAPSVGETFQGKRIINVEPLD